MALDNDRPVEVYQVPEEGKTLYELDSFFVLKSTVGNVSCSISRFAEIADATIRGESCDNKFNYLETESARRTGPTYDFLCDVIERAAKYVNDLTAVVETHHVDPTFRDLYYNHYSKRMFDMRRFSMRITLFCRALDDEAYTDAEEDELSGWVIGSTVLDPIKRGIVGRTLFNPRYVAGNHGGEIRVRLTDFEITVRGKRLVIPSFVYRHQDDEVMSCAEVTLLNLMCYYSNEYREYAVTTPSEILALQERHARQRVTPSLGLDFEDMSRIMARLRFHPRVYELNELSAIRQPAGLHVTGQDWMNRLLSWYTVSGIPVAVNVAPESSYQEGHSLICIGCECRHEQELETLRKSLSNSLEAG